MLALGVDIGGTNARVAVVDSQTGAVVRSAKESWSGREPSVVVETVAVLIEAVSKGLSPTAPLGVGFAGMLDGGRVLNAPNLGWRDVDFGPMLAGRTGRPVTLVNDLSVAAWGEYSAGSAKGVSDVLTVFVGTGVGSAIISHGQLLRGANNVAAEFGHIKVVLEGGRVCGCGQTGCLEAYMGGANLEASMREAGLEGNAAHLEALALTGEPAARKLYDFAVDHLGLALANFVTVLNPAVLVLGGGVLSNCPGMVERVTTLVHARANAPAAKKVRIVMASLGDDAGLVGAALLGTHPSP